MSRVNSQWAQALLAMSLGFGAAACGDHPSTAQCTQLLDRVIDQEIAATGGKDLPESMRADLAKQKTALDAKVRADFVKRCTEGMPTAAVECGLTAKTPEAFAKCDGN